MITRNYGINIRVTQAEKENIMRNARKCSLSLSEYLRQLAGGSEPKAYPSGELLQTIHHIQGISAKLNQAAGSMTEEKLRQQCVETSAELNQVLYSAMKIMSRHISE